MPGIPRVNMGATEGLKGKDGLGYAQMGLSVLGMADMVLIEGI